MLYFGFVSKQNKKKNFKPFAIYTRNAITDDFGDRAM